MSPFGYFLQSFFYRNWKGTYFCKCFFNENPAWFVLFVAFKVSSPSLNWNYNEMQTCKRSFLFPACMLHNDPFWRQTSLIYLFCFLLSMENRVFAVAIRQEVSYIQGRRKVWKSGGASSDGEGIVCPPWLCKNITTNVWSFLFSQSFSMTVRVITDLSKSLGAWHPRHPQGRRQAWYARSYEGLKIRGCQ